MLCPQIHNLIAPLLPLHDLDYLIGVIREPRWVSHVLGRANYPL